MVDIKRSIDIAFYCRNRLFDICFVRCVYVPKIHDDVGSGYGGSPAAAVIPGSAKWSEQKLSEPHDGEDEDNDAEKDADRALIISSACPTAKWTAVTLANATMSTSGAFYPRVFVNTISPILTAFNCDPKNTVFGSAFQKMGIGQGLKCDGVTLVISFFVYAIYNLH